MIKKQDIINNFVVKLSQDLPLFYNSVAPFLALKPYETIEHVHWNAFPVGKLNGIQDVIKNGTYIPELINTWEENVRLELYKKIFEAYCHMQIKSVETDEKEWLSAIYKTCDIIRQKGGVPAIFNYGVDLFDLEPKHQALHQENGLWYLNWDPIYDIGMQTAIMEKEASFLVIDKRELPFFAINPAFFLRQRPYGEICTTDPVQSFSIYEGYVYGQQLLIAQPLMPLLYNPQATITRLRINKNNYYM